MTTAGTQRRTVNLPRDPQAPINRLLTTKGPETATETLDTVLHRYMVTLRRSMPDFTVPEWCLIFDALKPPWTADEVRTAQLAHEITDAITIDNLDAKWPVDGQKLKNRIDRLNFPARMAIGEMTEAFWATESQANYDDIIAELLQIFGNPAKPPQQGRSNRMAIERMGPTEDPLPPQNNDHTVAETNQPSPSQPSANGAAAQSDAPEPSEDRQLADEPEPAHTATG